MIDTEEFNFDDLLEPDDPIYGKPVSPNAKEPPIVSLALEVLSEPEDQVQRDWIAKIFPYILDYFSLRPAKGMSRESALELTAKFEAEKQEKIVAKLVEKHVDQSLAVHLLNAALAGWSLVKLAKLNELEQRLYLAAITLHDLNKMGLRYLGDVRMDGDGQQKYRHLLEVWAEALKLWSFISRDYWQDIAFLAQNAEGSRGANLTPANHPDTQLPPEALVSLAEFVHFADLTASIAHHPDELVQEKLLAIVWRATGKKYTLRHHRTSENRGLLTQAIHNAVLERVRAVGWKPFLFFPDGVTYFAPTDGQEPDISNLAEAVRNYLLRTASKGLGSLFYRQPKGIIAYSPDVLEVADVETATTGLIQQTFTLLNDKRSPAGGTRREKILSQFPELSDLDWDYPVDTIQLDRLAEGLRGLVDVLKDYYGVSYEKASQALLKALGLENYWESLERIPAYGGVPHGWYFLAGHYIRQHRDINDAALETVMQEAVQQVLQDWGKPERPLSFTFLDQYIAQVLTFEQGSETRDFLGELNRYHRNKAKRRRENEAVCATCNSAFEVREEFANYSNKRITSLKQDSKRGICTVCQAEQLLRQYAMGRKLAAEDEVVYLHLYPDYYFTPETALIMSRAYDRFAQSVFTDLDKELAKQDYDPKLIPRADVFRIRVDPNQNQKRRIDKVEYPKGQMHGYYLLGVPYLGKKPTDTESWQMPALLALIAPVAFGIKVVASRSTMPPYDSGADFKETVILDGVHTSWLHAMREVRFRMDGSKGLQKAIPAAFSFYALTAQAYRDGKGYAVWNALNTVAQKLDTSPLYVFYYADRIQENLKKGKQKLSDPTMIVAQDLLKYHQLLSDYYGGDHHMEMIQGLVDRYAAFYRPKGLAAYARLRPLNEVAKRLLESSPSTSKEDLQLILEGYLLSLVDGILGKKVDGFVPLTKEELKNKVQIQLISEFSQYFLERVFYDYCRGERALLRQHINLIRHAAEAYYIKNYSKRSTEEA